MGDAAEMFSFDPNPTRAKKPGPFLLVYFMIKTLSSDFAIREKIVNIPYIYSGVTALKQYASGLNFNDVIGRSPQAQ